MRGYLRKRQRGFTLLELVVVAFIFAMLLGVYFRSIRYYQEMAEQAMVSLTLSNIRTGMAHEWAERINKGRGRDKVDDLIGANPVRWLENPPASYFGEIKSAHTESIDGGVWFFDSAQKELVYVVNIGSHLEMANLGERKVLRWKVAVEDNLGNKQADFGDLVLLPVTKYHWF